MRATSTLHRHSVKIDSAAQELKRLKMSDDWREESTDFGESGTFFDEFSGFDPEFDDDFGAVDFAAEALPRTRSYETLDAKTIGDAANEKVAHVKEICGLPSDTVAALLLRTHKWNSEKVIEKWMESPDAALKAAGIASGDVTRAPAKPREKVECPICLETCTAKSSYALGCGHRYCNDCWEQYLRTSLESAHTAAQTRCPWPKCGALAHDEAFEQHLTAQEYARYREFVRRSFVDANPKAKWCPAPGCGNAVVADVGSRKKAVTCGCGASWCFQCADFDIGDHSPATCQDVDRWMKKASDESENLTWLMANTKKCPKCRAAIEKNGGCMHMTCRKGGCGHEFCWLCRGPWSEHGSSTGGYYKCNKYEKNKDAVAADEAQRDAASELEHYMFYFHRYESHRNARRVATQQRIDCAAKQTALVTKLGIRSSDVNFLSEATEKLLQCRRVLEASYIYGYYLKNGKERSLFEYLQEDVERTTNLLSEQYEREVADIPDYAAFISWKEGVTNLARVCAKFCQNFSDGVENGLTTQ